LHWRRLDCRRFSGAPARRPVRFLRQGTLVTPRHARGPARSGRPQTGTLRRVRTNPRPPSSAAARDNDHPVFSEPTKVAVRRKAHLRCCLCHDIGVEVHHIIPRAEGGNDKAENAAPLCPSCHEKYGANPTKRKFVREARDVWYEICERRFGEDPSRLEEIRRTLDNVATKEDLEELLVTFVAGHERETEMLSLAHEVFTELETARYQLDEAKGGDAGGARSTCSQAPSSTSGSSTGLQYATPT
jgi:5-methylcytosine-specific restriction endonuclease McrA